jgi:hypothetical protein
MEAVTVQMHQMCYAGQTVPNFFCSHFVVIVNMYADVILTF